MPIKHGVYHSWQQFTKKKRLECGSGNYNDIDKLMDTLIHYSILRLQSLENVSSHLVKAFISCYQWMKKRQKRR